MKTISEEWKMLLLLCQGLNFRNISQIALNMYFCQREREINGAKKVVYSYIATTSKALEGDSLKST
jgi:hypothetical protein